MELKKYLRLITTSINNNGLIIEPPQKPFVLQTHKGSPIKLDTPKTYIKFTNGHSLKYKERADIVDGIIHEFKNFSYHFQPKQSTINKHEGFWPFRVDKNKKQGLHGNHEGWRNEWPHELKKGDTNLNIQDFNLLVAINVCFEYIKTKNYPFDTSHKYNQIIHDTIRRLI